MLGLGTAPVHPALAEPLDKKSFRGQPQQHSSFQVTEEAVHGFSQVQRKGNGGRRREADQLGTTGPINVFISQGDLTVQDEAPVRGLGGGLHHSLAVVQQHHLQAKVCTHTYKRRLVEVGLCKDVLVCSSPEIVRPGVKKLRGARCCFGGLTSTDPQYMCSFISNSEEKRGGGGDKNLAIT